MSRGRTRSWGSWRSEQGRLPAGSSLALFSTDEARSLFQMPDSDNRVAIRLEPGADPEQVAAAVRTVLPGGAEVVDGATGALHRQESITRSFALIRLLITAFALLALIVGMVTVANSLTLLYSERRRTFAALRLVGAHERQLLAVALVEAAMLAGVASLLGAPLGLVLGRIIEGARWVHSVRRSRSLARSSPCRRSSGLS
ncbi:MAG: ABC transporter permease [Microthrixaceae bacterium]